MKLKGKVALVTGVSPNIGGGIIESLAAEGAAIVAVDSVAANAADAAAYLNSIGCRAIGVTCDVRMEDQVISTVAQAVDSFGQIDILVNNAAYFNRKGVTTMAYAEWQDQLAVMLGGTFLFTQHVGRVMIERGHGGAMINIISTAGHQGEPGNIAYCTAKSGLLNFTRAVAMEMAEHGVRVNSLTPTATETSEQIDRAARWGRTLVLPDTVEPIMKPFRNGIPLQKLPRPSDYGKAAVFLASDDAEMITGVDLRVDAGAVARYWAWNPTAT